MIFIRLKMAVIAARLLRRSYYMRVSISRAAGSIIWIGLLPVVHSLDVESV